MRSAALRCLALVLAAAGAVVLLPANQVRAQAEAGLASSVPPGDIDFASFVPKNVDDLKAFQQHVQALSRKLQTSTVAVRVGASRGSGVVVSRDGFVMTAAHVAERQGLDVSLISADGNVLQGETLGVNQSKDIGLIKVDGDLAGVSYAELGDANQLKPGDWVMAYGHPGGHKPGRRPVVRLGRVLDRRSNIILTDCPLVGGDSGGPLFDMQGRVVGIHSRIGESLAANLHVPVNLYRRRWDSMVSDQQQQPDDETNRNGPFIGVLGDPDGDEAIIVRIADGSPAEKAGMQVGDVVIVFDERGVGNFSNLVRMVRQKEAGEVVKVIIRRGNELVRLEVVIADRASKKQEL